MEENYAIEVNHVTKSFKIFLDKGHEIKDYVTSSRRRKYENREVLKDISFKVRKGEAIGLIGHNGCGKSTTLKLLTRIMYPDSGTITMRGRVSSLIELGAGFHPDMSGRENIYINASIFGLTKKEIDRRLEDIIAFSELEEFIDNPVRTYSSGMYMRLAFAVAINVDADILLIDEILAVGDVNFQAKCFNRLREIKAEGTTIVIVSHSMGQIEQICDRSLWIHNGFIRAEGLPRDVHPEYLDYMGEKRQETANKEIVQQKVKQTVAEIKEVPICIGDVVKEKKEEKEIEPTKNTKRWGNGLAQIESVVLIDSKGTSQFVFKTGEKIQIVISYTVKERIRDAVFGIGIFRSDGLQCYGTNTRIDRFDEFELNKAGEIAVTLSPLSLLPGKYLLDVAIETENGIPVDYFREVCSFEVFSDVADVGVQRITHEWNLGILVDNR